MSTGGNQDEILLKLRLEADQAKKELEEVRRSAGRTSQSVMAAVATQGAGMVPNIFQNAASGVMNNIANVGTSQLGAMAQRASEAFFGRNSVVTDTIKNLRDFAGDYSAESAANDRTVNMAKEFARQGIPVDSKLLGGMNEIIYAQEKAAEDADTMAKNASYDKRASRREDDYNDSMRWINKMLSQGVGALFR